MFLELVVITVPTGGKAEHCLCKDCEEDRHEATEDIYVAAAHETVR